MKHSKLLAVVITSVLVLSGCASTGTGITTNNTDVRTAIEIGRIVGRVAIVKTLTAHGVSATTAQMSIAAIDPVIDAAIATGKLDLIFSPELFKPVRDDLASKAGKALAQAVNDPSLPEASAVALVGELIDAVANRVRATHATPATVTVSTP